MRFYQLEAKKLVPVPDNNPIVVVVPQWLGTERDAIVTRNEMYKAGKLAGLKRESLVTAVDVPTDKAGLLKFLQANVPDLVVV